MKRKNRHLALALILAINIGCMERMSAQGNGRQLDTVSIPRLAVESILYNYGEVIRGEKIIHAFTVRNIGKDDLIIKKASPD